jgi:hypothetical protein
MGASNEIKLKIGGDTASLERSFAKLPAMAEAAGKKAESAWNRNARFGAQQKLTQFREANQFAEANTIGKIKIITEQLQDLAYARARTEKGTTKELEAQLAIEQKMIALRKLQRQAQAERGVGASQTGTESAAAAEAQDARGNMGGMLARFAAGASAAIGAAVTGYFERAATRAESEQATSRSSLDTLRNTFGTMGGIGEQLRQTKKRERDLEIDESLKRNELARLKGENPIEPLGSRRYPETAEGRVSRFKDLAVQKITQAAAFVSPQSIAMIEKASEELQTIKRETVEAFNQSKLLAREATKQTLAYVNQRATIREITKLQKEGRADAVTMAKVELDRLRAVQMIANSLGTEEEKRAAALATGTQRGVLATTRREMERRQVDTNTALTQDAAQGRTNAQGQRRPRSETERLADRAEAFRQRARDRALTGAGGAGAMMEKALLAESAVASRLGRATEDVRRPKGTEDATAIKAEIVNSNNLLKGIKDALTPTGVD